MALNSTCHAGESSPSLKGEMLTLKEGLCRPTVAPTCIMAPMISVTFLGINLNGGKTWMRRQKREGTSICKLALAVHDMH